MSAGQKGDKTKIMKSRLLNILLIVFLFALTANAAAATGATREYQVKAAFLYNFIKFLDWPQNKEVADAGQIKIVVIGKNPFGNAFVPILKKTVRNKKLKIVYFDCITKLNEQDKASLKKSHMLFICKSEKDRLKSILEITQQSSVLTVSEISGFLEAKGMIRFLMEKEKVRFEINAAVAQKSNLEIRAQLLRLAKRVIK